MKEQLTRKEAMQKCLQYMKDMEFARQELDSEIPTYYMEESRFEAVAKLVLPNYLKLEDGIYVSFYILCPDKYLAGSYRVIYWNPVDGHVLFCDEDGKPLECINQALRYISKSRYLKEISKEEFDEMKGKSRIREKQNERET